MAKRTSIKDIKVKSVFRDKEGNIIVKVGDTIKWDTIGGKVYQGEVVEIDSNVAYVHVKGKGTKTVEM